MVSPQRLRTQRPKLSWLPLTEAIADAARAGLGVAVLSEWIASGYLGGGDLIAKQFAPRVRLPSFTRRSARPR
jgi:DNA-binding transcriptional LysR family regulator